MKYKPLKVQEEAYRFLLKNKQAGLFVKMGVGKTVVALTLAESLIYEYAMVCRVLVIAPLRVAKITWPDEIEKWQHTRRLSYTVVHGNNKPKLARESRNTDITLINFDGLNFYIRNHHLFGRYDMVIVDESTFVKNPKAARTKIAFKLSRWISRRIILTGSPTPNSIEDIWAQIFLLDRGQRLGGEMKEFYANYFYPNTNPNSYKKYFLRKGARQEIVKAISDIVMVVEDTSNLGLPAVKHNVIKVQLDKKGRKHYNEIEKNFFTSLDRFTDLHILNQQAQTQKLRQVLSGFVYVKQEDSTNKVVEIHKEKLKALKELRESLSGNSILVAVQFQEDAELIKRFFKEDIPTINSNTPEKKSIEYIRRWKRGELSMMMAHPESIGHGLNLQEAGYNTVWYSTTWSLEEWSQFIARLARRGQAKSTVFNHILITTDSIDEVMYEAISRKDANQQTILAALKQYRHAKNNRR